MTPDDPRRSQAAAILAGAQGTRQTQETQRTRETRQTRDTRTAVKVPADLADRLRDAADALSGPPVRATLAGIVAEAIRRELARLEHEHNAGEPFPPRPGPLHRGRRQGG